MVSKRHFYKLEQSLMRVESGVQSEFVDFLGFQKITKNVITLKIKHCLKQNRQLFVTFYKNLQNSLKFYSVINTFVRKVLGQKQSFFKKMEKMSFLDKQ